MLQWDNERICAWVAEHGSPLFIIDRAALTRRLELLHQFLPKVRPFYALKALSHPSVAKHLESLGTDIEIASLGELSIVQEAGFTSDRVLYTHPYRIPEQLEAFTAFNPALWAFDSLHELKKLAPYRDKIKLMLRLAFPNQVAKIPLSDKFGCLPETADHMITQARNAGFQVEGICFHVGSQSIQADTYSIAIPESYAIMKRHHLSILDIGGGFPTQHTHENGLLSDDLVAQFFETLRTLLAPVFADGRSVYCEPGRFLIADCGFSIARVIGVNERDNVPYYYLDDGVYGSYSGQIYDHAQYPVHAIAQNGQSFDDKKLRKSTLFGLTCDSIDCIRQFVLLPNLKEGDIIVGSHMGAYTLASATEFNQFPKPKVITTDQSFVYF